MPVQRNAAPEKPVEIEEVQVEEITREPVSSEATKQDLPAKKEDVNEVPQSYVHLADGSVLKVNDEDLPDAGGSLSTPHGYWQRGNKVYQVVGVYPTESVVEES